MSYLQKIFTDNINKNNVKIIFEIGSCHLIDTNELQKYYDAEVYAFECNPECLVECHKNLQLFNNLNIHLIEKAITDENSEEKVFYPFDLSKYNNMGASSMLKIDFSMRNKTDGDYGKPNPQKEIVVQSTRLDNFCHDNNKIPDMLCVDVQGYELNVMKSMDEMLKQVKYIITETAIQSTYIGGASFEKLNEFMKKMGFEYKCSTAYLQQHNFGMNFPDLTLTGFSEFDCLFVNKNI